MSRSATVATLWVPGPLPGLNEIIDAAKGAGGRGMAYAALKRQWTQLVWAVTKESRLDKLGAFPAPVHITFDWVEKDKRRDKDNVAAGGRKVILDGLVMAGVLAGDGWKWIEGWDDRFTVSERPGCGLTIVMLTPSTEAA